jgi:spore germination protein
MTIHIVQKGDSLYSIARSYGVSWQRIMEDNGLRPGEQLVVGQALIITLPDELYTVRQGDSIYSIAASHGITEIELMQNNPVLIFSPTVYPGQVLTISFKGNKTRTINITGYAYPNINISILRRALPYLTYMAVFSYTFTSDGTLEDVNDEQIIKIAGEYRVAPVMVLSSIAETGGFSTEKAAMLFNDKAMQDKVLDQVERVMLQKGFVGLESDFEYIDPQDAQGYLDFLKNAGARMQKYGFFLEVALAPKTSAGQPGLLYEAHDYPSIGAVADSVFLMTYEWGYTFGPPMAVAPINLVRNVVRYAVSAIPAEKVYMGIPNYGYDWALPYVRETSRAEAIGNQTAVDRARRYGAEIKFDEKAQAPFYNYYSSDRRQHIVWFNDVRSVQAALNLADEFRLPGVGYWTVMRPYNQNWAYISTKYNVNKVI